MAGTSLKWRRKVVPPWNLRSNGPPINYAQNSGLSKCNFLDAHWITWKLCSEPKIHYPKIVLSKKGFWGVEQFGDLASDSSPPQSPQTKALLNCICFECFTKHGQHFASKLPNLASHCQSTICLWAGWRSLLARSSCYLGAIDLLRGGIEWGSIAWCRRT